MATIKVQVVRAQAGLQNYNCLGSSTVIYTHTPPHPLHDEQASCEAARLLKQAI